MAPDPKLFAAVAATAFLFMVFQQLGWKRSAMCTKPVPVLLLLAGAAFCGEPRDPAARNLVLLGLGACAIGDVCLALPGDRFLAGLFAFLLGHLLYLAAFLHPAPAGAWTSGLPFAALYLTVAVAIYAVLYPGLGAFRLPCAGYVLAISAMASAAGLRGVVDGSPLAPIGATLFFASDAILAIDRFRCPLRWAKIVLFSLYIAGQAFITASIWRVPA